MDGTGTRWRPHQTGHDRAAREVLTEGGGARFRDWIAVIMFYEIVIILDGYAEARGMPAPKNHKTRRAVVRRHLPHLVDFYDDLYALSLEARYYKGYAMTEGEARRAARCHGILERNIPAP